MKRSVDDLTHSIPPMRHSGPSTSFHFDKFRNKFENAIRLLLCLFDNSKENKAKDDIRQLEFPMRT